MKSTNPRKYAGADAGNPDAAAAADFLAGVDWPSLPADVLTSIVQQVNDAMGTGVEANDAAAAYAENAVAMAESRLVAAHFDRFSESFKKTGMTKSGFVGNFQKLRRAGVTVRQYLGKAA